MRLRYAIALVALGALTTAAAAHADLVVAGPSPTLNGTGATTISLAPPAPASRIEILVPAGFEANIGQAPGTTVGTIDTGGQSGPLVAADPGSEACGAATPDAVWLLAPAGGAGLAVTVDRLAAGDPDASFASYRLSVCPGEGSLSRLELRLDDVFRTPNRAGEYAWRAITTAGPDTDPVESRSTQTLPVKLTLRGSFARGTGTATLRGLLTAGGSTVAGAEVVVRGGRPGKLVRVASATTGSQGGFRVRRPLTRTQTFEATARIAASPDPAGCPDPIAGGGCVSATLAPAEVTSRRVTVRVPVPRVVRLGSAGADVRRLRAELVRLRYLPPGGQGARFDDRTWHAVVALQGWLRLTRTGIVDRRTWRALQHAGVPAPWAHLRRALLIDTARQVMLLVDGGRTVRAIHVSTGSGGRTPLGHFGVYRKELLSWSVAFGVWLPYASYFTGGFALHSYPDVPSYPASHGCVRVPATEAPGVYRFASYGTPVWVR